MIPSVGFSLQPKYDRPLTQVIALLKDAGFSAVSPLWSPDLDLSALTACVKAQNMTIQSLHAPHKDIPLLWEPDRADACLVQQNMLSSIDACARFEIPILVVHGWQGLNYTFPNTPLNFRFLDEMVQRAQDCGTQIAFENLEGEEYLDALMQRYENLPNVGFCWDSGHDMCYPHKQNYLKSYGNRLIMTHLNDNLGVRDPAGVHSKMDDLHWLPYDGCIYWEDTLAQLRQARKQQILNFELKIVSHSKDPADLPYVHMSLEDFLREAGKRALDIAEKYA